MFGAIHGWADCLLAANADSPDAAASRLSLVRHNPRLDETAANRGADRCGPCGIERIAHEVFRRSVGIDDAVAPSNIPPARRVDSRRRPGPHHDVARHMELR